MAANLFAAELAVSVMHVHERARHTLRSRRPQNDLAFVRDLPGPVVAHADQAESLKRTREAPDVRLALLDASHQLLEARGTRPELDEKRASRRAQSATMVVDLRFVSSRGRALFNQALQ